MCSRSGSGKILFPPLVSGTLIRRYKRFLVDVYLETGETVTAHCPNPGSMLECYEPGRRVFVSRHQTSTRKLPYTWQLIQMPDSLVCVNSLLPNQIVFEALQVGKIPELDGYDHIQKESKIGGSRLDLLLTNSKGSHCFVEIKNCTLVKDGIAQFPDAKTSRGVKHLLELERLVHAGYRGVMVYVIQRMDAVVFTPADDIDPIYGKILRQAIHNGVEMVVYDVIIDTTHIVLNQKIPYRL